MAVLELHQKLYYEFEEEEARYIMVSITKNSPVKDDSFYYSGIAELEAYGDLLSTPALNKQRSHRKHQQMRLLRTSETPAAAETMLIKKMTKSPTSLLFQLHRSCSSCRNRGGSCYS